MSEEQETKEVVIKEVELHQSENIDKISDALAKAQGLVGNAHKDSENPYFESSYADLASCWDACREALSKNDLSVIQTHRKCPKGELMMVTQLNHKSGQYFRGTITMFLAKNDPQSYGSATTYARRYGLCAMVGVAPADDDGNGASGKEPKPATRPRSTSSGKGKGKGKDAKPAESKKAPETSSSDEDDDF